jgi:hypothetical protein
MSRGRISPRKGTIVLPGTVDKVIHVTRTKHVTVWVVSRMNSVSPELGNYPHYHPSTDNRMKDLIIVDQSLHLNQIID